MSPYQFSVKDDNEYNKILCNKIIEGQVYTLEFDMENEYTNVTNILNSLKHENSYVLTIIICLKTDPKLSKEFWEELKNGLHSKTSRVNRLIFLGIRRYFEIGHVNISLTYLDQIINDKNNKIQSLTFYHIKITELSLFRIKRNLNEERNNKYMVQLCNVVIENLTENDEFITNLKICDNTKLPKKFIENGINIETLEIRLSLVHNNILEEISNLLKNEKNVLCKLYYQNAKTYKYNDETQNNFLKSLGNENCKLVDLELINFYIKNTFELTKSILLNDINRVVIKDISENEDDYEEETYEKLKENVKLIETILSAQTIKRLSNNEECYIKKLPTDVIRILHDMMFLQ